VTTTDTEPAYAAEHEPDDVLDEEWLASTQGRSRLRSILLITLAASVVFLGGVLVQREFGSAGSSSAAAGPLRGGLPEGIPQGMPGGGGLPSGMPVPGSGQGGDQPAEVARTSIVGTVVAIDGDVWTVEDLGGTSHQVVVREAAKIVRETTVSAAGVELDSTVDITLSDDGSGSDTASDVVIRSSLAHP